MRFQTILASALVVLVGTVAAQSSPDMPDVPTQACIQCLNKNGLAVPVCNNMAGNPNVSNPNTADAAAKTCMCALASSRSWLNNCQGGDQCSASLISMLNQAYDTVKPTVCQGVSAASLNGAGSLSVPKAGAAALVVAAAAAQILM
ncbi:hypothetical protein EDD11_000989 [Mortierella claussenii]|nr:hypothetical protein EDD11_000989 [Mortierella claussenii]